MENTCKFCSNCGTNLQHFSSGTSQVIYLRSDVSNEEPLIETNDDDGNVNWAEVALNPEELQAMAYDFLATASDDADVHEIRQALEERLNNFTNVKFNIGIVGESGTGKSSFINALLGLESGDEGAATVGLLETTQTPTEYIQINNHNLVFWDLPGVGTINFPRETYLKDINFDTYNFFILVTASRFKENDTWLAKEIIRREKRFYFVRAKIDLDIQCEFRNPKTRFKSHDQLLKLLKEDSVRQLKDSGVTNPDVFLLNNTNTHEYDFSALTKKLINDLPRLEKEALAWYMSVITLGVLEEKMLLFKKRIYVIALKSAIGAAVPIPLVGWMVDVDFLMKETQLYKAQTGTDDKSIGKLARKLGIQLSDLINDKEVDTSTVINSATSFLNFCTSMGLAKKVSNCTKLVLPCIGSIVSTPAAYCQSVYIQQRMLALCYAEAQKIFRIRMDVFQKPTLDDSS